MALIKKILQSNKLIWKIFGNDEDPIPPDWFMPNKNENLREFMWFFIRNSLHNFCARIIGTYDYPAECKSWNSERSWNLILPFFSYRGKRFRFYIGWRPSLRENNRFVQSFGIAFKLKEKQEV
jgi:hypothetical protein